MEQDHTEENILRTQGEQNTGNHHKPASPGQPNADRIGGTRSGAENVEPARPDAVQSGPDIDRVAPLDDGPSPDLTGTRHAERREERDERGRL
ncbi:hypothetical protein [Rhizosaccharibacter radicis]|uniref:Uncharacterized protein n=1 Tax=Rhizosaccharibacter radicis TaxID=2782605 RepID=A0ABT1VZA2_9PROT|nr:hypothetical protein [Acetobacteraceae bacterium KSS12]